MKSKMFFVIFLSWCIPALADDSKFSTHLYPKFQAKACTTCHDFFEEKRGGIAFNSHKGRTPEMCVFCHTQEVTGFKHPDEWFAQPGLYTSGMDPQQTCEAIKTALHAKFKNKTLIARQLKHHLFDDPRILWGIEGATPNSGMLPSGEKEKDLVKDGLTKWTDQINAWIDGGMKCE